MRRDLSPTWAAQPGQLSGALSTSCCSLADIADMAAYLAPPDESDKRPGSISENLPQFGVFDLSFNCVAAIFVGVLQKLLAILHSATICFYCLDGGENAGKSDAAHLLLRWTQRNLEGGSGVSTVGTARAQSGAMAECFFSTKLRRPSGMLSSRSFGIAAKKSFRLSLCTTVLLYHSHRNHTQGPTSKKLLQNCERTGCHCPISFEFCKNFLR